MHHVYIFFGDFLTGFDLVLIKPLGFSFSDRYLKRAGLDYIEDVNISFFDSLESYLDQEDLPFYFFSSHGKHIYSDVDYSKACSLIFGAETHGLPSFVFETYSKSIVTMPMVTGARCLNLSNTVAIASYEVLRQNQQFLGQTTIRVSERISWGFG